MYHLQHSKNKTTLHISHHITSNDRYFNDNFYSTVGSVGRHCSISSESICKLFYSCYCISKRGAWINQIKIDALSQLFMYNYFLKNLWNKKENGISIRLFRKMLNLYFRYRDDTTRANILIKLWKSDAGFAYLTNRKISDEVIEVFYTELKNFDYIYEVGTGNGYLLEMLAKKMPDKNFVGIDLNDSQINENKLKYIHNKRFTFVCDDIFHYIETVGSVVFISYVSLTTFTHIAVENLFAKIKKDSYIICYEPAIDCEIIDNKESIRGLAFFHDYEKLLSQHGFTIIKKEYFNSRFIFIVGIKN